MIIVARIPPTILITYLISSSRVEKLFGLMPSMAETVPAVAAVPRMKFKIECIIIYVFKFTTKVKHKTGITICKALKYGFYDELFTLALSIAERN